MCFYKKWLRFILFRLYRMKNAITHSSKVAKKYECIICDYNTSRKSSYDKHLITRVHTYRTELNKIEQNAINSIKNKPKFICTKCNKCYTARNSLWYHSKKCVETKTNIKEPEINTNEHFFTPNIIMEMMKQNNEFKELLVEQGKQMAEQNKQIIELSSKPTTTNNNNNTTNNNNNFNLNFFLNETCKDALNITDFISQLHVGIKDLEETGRLGYADGISKIFINGLKQLEINQRPVHCSDAKRETIYIKDKNQWEKDDEEKVKLTKAIKSVAHKNIEQIAVWTEKHPEYMDYNSKYSEKYMKILGEAMPGATYAESDKNYKKIARNITKETIIDK